MCFHDSGLSEDVEVRLGQHNAGKSNFTKAKGPWTLIWTSDAVPLREARLLENKLKRQKGGNGLKQMIGLDPLQAHNPAKAGSWVQIPPPQPLYYSVRCSFSENYSES